MSRGAFFLALLLIVLGLTFLVAALRGRGIRMITALQQVASTTPSAGAKGSQAKAQK